MVILDKQQKMLDKISRKFNIVDERKEELINKHINYLLAEADLELLLSKTDNPGVEDLKLKKDLSAKLKENRKQIKAEYPEINLGADFIIKGIRISINDIEGEYSSPEYDKFKKLQDEREKKLLGRL